MAVVTFEGIVEAGQIRLLNGEQLPDKATVYIIVPNYKDDEQTQYAVTIPANPRIRSPHLVNKEDAQHFKVEVVEDARV